MSSYPRACRKLRERLPEQADGSLQGRTRTEMERHLASCARCRAELDDLRLVIRAVRAVQPETMPEDLAPRAQRAARPSAAPLAPGQFWARVAVPVALATGLVALALAFRTTGPESMARLSRQTAGGLAGRTPREVASSGRAMPPVPAVVPAAPAPAGPVGQELAPTRRPGQQQAAVQPGEPPAPAAKARPAVAEEAQPALQLGLRGEQKLEAAKAPASAEPMMGAAGKAPRTGAPPDTLREGVDQRQARAPGRRWFAGGLGGGRAGGGAGPAGPLGPPGPTGPPGPRRLPRHPAAASDLAAQKRTPTVLPVLARASLLRQDGRSAIALQFGGPGAAGELTVSLGAADKRRSVYRGLAANAPPLIFSLSEIGVAPNSIPITVESASGAQDLVLFTPTAARLGEVSARAPRVHYDGQPLRKVLSDLSALTGLVLLVDGPLDRKVVGDLPEGSPESALEAVALGANLQVERQDNGVYLLTPRR